MMRVLWLKRCQRKSEHRTTPHHAWESSQIPICPQHSIFSHKSHKSHFPQFSIFSSLPPSPCHRRPCSPLNCSRVILLAKARSCFWNISIVCWEWWLKQDDELKSEKRCADGMSAFHFEFLKLFHPFNFTPWCLTLFVVHVEEFGGTGNVWITSEGIRDFNYCYRTITYMFGRLFNYIIK